VITAFERSKITRALARVTNIQSNKGEKFQSLETIIWFFVEMVKVKVNCLCD